MSLRNHPVHTHTHIFTRTHIKHKLITRLKNEQSCIALKMLREAIIFKQEHQYSYLMQKLYLSLVNEIIF